MRSPLQSLVTEKSLAFISSLGNPELVDQILEHADPRSIPMPLKNVCAKVTVELAAQIDEVVDLLGISKRRFLEAAYIEAVRVSKEIMEAEGVYELLAHNSAARQGQEEAAS